MKIQLDIPEQIMDKLAISKIQLKLKTKADVVVKILEEYYKK